MPGEQAIWRVLREDEDYGPGTYEVGLEGDAPPPGDEKLVLESAESELRELREGLEEIENMAAQAAATNSTYRLTPATYRRIAAKARSLLTNQETES